jgi:flagella basal body P-ring formation protein FlgA
VWPTLLAAGCAASAFAESRRNGAATTRRRRHRPTPPPQPPSPEVPAGADRRPAGQGDDRLEGRGTAALPACEASPEVFLPPGATPWGRVSVGVRCQAERPWMRYVQAHVAVEGSYFVAARAIDAGRPAGRGRRQRTHGRPDAAAALGDHQRRRAHGVVA